MLFNNFSLIRYMNAITNMSYPYHRVRDDTVTARRAAMLELDLFIDAVVPKEEHPCKAQLIPSSFDLPTLDAMGMVYNNVIMNLTTRIYEKDGSFLKFYDERKDQLLPLHHEHPNLASLRNYATKLIMKFSRYRGKPLYDVDSSMRVRSQGERGCHTFHSLRDTAQPGYCDRIPSDAIVSFIDSDYYHDDLYRYIGHDMVLFTFNPSELSGIYEEGSFDFLNEHTVRLYVQGGPKDGYRHALFNYSSDSMRFQKRGYTYVYRCETRPLSAHHHLVVLTLVSRSLNPYNLIWKHIGFMADTERVVHNLNPLSCGGYYRYVLKTFRDIKIGKSRTKRVFQATGISGFKSIEVDASTIDVIATKATMNGGLMAGDIQGITKHSLDVETCTLLSVIFKEGNPILNKELVRYTLYSEDKLDEEGETDMSKDTAADEVTRAAQRHCADLTDTPLGVPNDNLRNEQTTQKMRVENVRNNVDPSALDPRINRWAAEFIQKLMRGSRNGKPLSREEVIKRQSRPLQKARNKKLGNTINEKPSLGTFLKSEPVDPTKPARQIGQFNTEHCIEMSRYTYALKDRVLSDLKLCAWYAPGKTPKQLHLLVGKVMNMVNKELKLLGIDYSKYDGSQSQFLRAFERALYMYYFRDDKHLGTLFDQEVQTKSHSKKMKKKGSDPAFLRWRHLWSRVSGSPLTTDGNTIIAAFIAYCYHRSEGRCVKAAWDNIGVKGGDDGIDLGNYVAFEKIATGVFGMKVTGGQFEKGWVPFYSRIFLLTESNVTSFCDPLRALGKWHIGMNKMVPYYVSHMNKALGYEVTDSNTIIIGDLVKLVKASFINIPIKFDDMDYSVKAYLKKDNEGWRPEPVAVAVQSSILAEYLEVSSSVFTEAIKAIRACKHVDNLKCVINLGKGIQYVGPHRNVKIGNGFVELSDKAKNLITDVMGRGRKPKINENNEKSKSNKPAARSNAGSKRKA